MQCVNIEFVFNRSTFTLHLHFQLQLEPQHQQQRWQQQRLCHQIQMQEQEQEQEVQRVTLRAGSLLESETAGGAASGSGWRISPIPWRMLLPPDPDQVSCSTHVQGRLV